MIKRDKILLFINIASIEPWNCHFIRAFIED